MTGLYGGGILLADSEDGLDLSGILELRPDQTYRLIGSMVSTNQRYYGDLAIADQGLFGGVLYITETVHNEIQQIDPNGTHSTWATGFVDIDALSISPDGNFIVVCPITETSITSHFFSCIT